MAASLPSRDAALLIQNPARIAQMAASLRRLGVPDSEAEAIRALSFHGSYSPIEIALLAGKALERARAQ